MRYDTGHIILVVMTMLLVISLLSVSHAEETTFETGKYMSAKGTDYAETMVITFLNKQEKRYLNPKNAISYIR